MLSFFTEPYPDELIYSAIARYHFYSGNSDCKDTLEEAFQSRNVIPSVEIGSHFSNLAKQIGSHYSVESILAKHTIYPFYAPFLAKDRQRQIMQDVQGDGKGIYARLGIVAGGICKKDGLYYCPRCAHADIEKFGEPYIHREHQLQGIDFCAHHELSLKKYPFDPLMKSRIEYIRFDVKKLNLNLSVLNDVESQDYLEVQIKLAKMAYELLNAEIGGLSREMIKKKYRLLLRERNLITSSNRVRQEDLQKAFTTKFPKGFLERYDSQLNKDDEYNWLKVLTRNVKRHVHPFRQLLFLYSLDQGVQKFLELEEDEGPFGKGPWPCLNKAANHYKQNVISKVTVTTDSKSNSPIGTFNCSCNFIYARKGPDKLAQDQYRIGRVKTFGTIWTAKLHTLANEGELSTRALARVLGVDSKTVKRHLYFAEEDLKIQAPKQTPKLLEYREQILKGIQQHISYTRTQIRKCYPKQYMHLYRHDKEWLFEQLPVKTKKEVANTVVNWSARDKDYYTKVKQLYMELMDLEKPIRITSSLIGKRLGILANLDMHIDKMPMTKKLLNDIKESTQQFQIRRCCEIIDRMLQEQEPIALWKVQRIGALKSHHFHEIKPYLETYVRMKQEVEYNEQTTG